MTEPNPPIPAIGDQVLYCYQPTNTVEPYDCPALVVDLIPPYDPAAGAVLSIVFFTDGNDQGPPGTMFNKTAQYNPERMPNTWRPRP